MNEFRAKLDGDGKRPIAMRKDPTPDTFSRLENRDGEPLFDQHSRRCESRDAGTEHDGIHPRLLALHGASFRAEGVPNQTRPLLPPIARRT